MDFVTEDDIKLLAESELEKKNKNILLLLRDCPGAGKAQIHVYIY